jgi:hypothetical protein
VFGSIIGFSLYFWLVRNASPALVGTYACANPIVALALGAWLADEPLTPRTLLAAGLVVAGVAVVTVGQRWSGPLRGRVDWFRWMVYPGAAGGTDGADHHGPRGLAGGPRAAAPQAR